MEYDEMVRRAERAARRYAQSKRDTTTETRARVRAAQFAQAAVDNVTTGVIDDWGVSTIRRISYMTFGRSVWALLSTEMSGDSLRLETLTLVNCWIARGLEGELLERVAAALKLRFEDAVKEANAAARSGQGPGRTNAEGRVQNAESRTGRGNRNRRLGTANRKPAERSEKAMSDE